MFEQLSVALAQFHFIRPYFLLGLIPLAALGVLLLRRRFGRGRWESVCDPALLPHVLVERAKQRRRWPIWAVFAGGALGILALAGPTWERLPVPVFRNESALVIVLDLSRSMDAGDVSPSRLVRARYKIEDILHRRTEGQTGLVVFAEQAFSVTPLTTDVETIISQLSALNSDLMPVQGSRADRGLRKAEKLLQQAGATRGDVLLITDGVTPAEQQRIDSLLKHYPYRLSVLGVGTAQGAPIPLPAGGFVQNAHGAIVISKLDAGSLRALANRGGGVYVHLQPGDSDVAALTREFKPSRLAAPVKSTRLKADTWREEGPWLLLVLLPIAALAFRRGVLAVLCLGILLPMARPAQAFGWSDLWLRPDQQASRALARGNPAAAARLFRNPRWKAAADYRAGNFANALQDLKAPSTADDWYNRGNALARLGHLRKALHAYDEALKLDPQHADARYNRKLVEKALHSQEKNGSNDGSNPNNQQGERKSDTQGKRQGRGGNGDNSARDRNGPEHQAQSDQRQQTRGRNNASGKPGTRGKMQDKAAGSGQTRKQPGAGQRAKAAGDKGSPDNRRQQAARASKGRPSETGPEKESKQAEEQWLRRIPDDPGGLLRRKFLYQYRKEINRDSNDDNDPPW